jgi:hypothetical protein
MFSHGVQYGVVEHYVLPGSEVLSGFKFPLVGLWDIYHWAAACGVLNRRPTIMGSIGYLVKCMHPV